MKRGVSFFVGLGLLAGGLAVPAMPAYATDASGTTTFDDAANGVSTVEFSYDDNVTTMHVDFRFDGAAVEKILAQRSGVGSSPGSYYSTINPGYNFTAPFMRGNVNYDPANDELNSPEAIEVAFDDNVEACSAYYHGFWPSVDEHTFCASEAYWKSTNPSFWQSFARVEYKKDGTWIDASRDTVNFASPSDTSEIKSIGERLVAALGLTDQDELVYGENWRVKADSYGTAWIYRQNYTDSDTVSEYFKVYATVEEAFDYMVVGEKGQYIYQPTLEAALASEYDTIIVNKDTNVETLEVPEGKTLIERGGEVTISDLMGSRIEGTYTKKDGADYHIVKIPTVANGSLTVDGKNTALVEVGEEYALELEVSDGYRIKSLKIDDEEADILALSMTNGEIEMPNYDTILEIEFEEWEIVVEADTEDEMEGDDDRAAVETFVAEQLKTLIDENADSNEYVDINDVEYVKDLYKIGGKVVTSLEVSEEIDEEDYEFLDAYEEVFELIGENEKIASVREAFILLNSALGDDLISDFGIVYQLDSPITMKFTIPEGLRTAPEGYERVWTVIRGHVDANDEESADRIGAVFDGENAVFDTDKFSSFVVVYEDQPIVTTPETGAFTKGANSAVESKISVAVVLISTIMIMIGTRMMSLGFAGVSRSKNLKA